jgi:acetyltransferase-like isoleucine patch superfamily enzyme
MPTLITTGHPVSDGPPAPIPSPPPAPRNLPRAALKALASALGVALATLPALTCWAEALVSDREECFLFWGQALSLVPGLPGKFLRRGFYYLTLRKGSLTCDIGFLSYFTDRRSELGNRVYVGYGVVLGLVTIGDGCLLGSRVSLLNGGQQHTLGPDAQLSPFDRLKASRLYLGDQTWIGEGAIVMANIGHHCIVGAGSLVSRQVPDGCVVAGNPARLIRKQTVPSLP